MALDRRHLTLLESKEETLDISDEEAAQLKVLGAHLASKKEWWGAHGEGREASVISCTPSASGGWRVRVSDAVGVISLSTLQLTIEPKIPTHHLLFLFEASRQFPRLAPERAAAMRDMYLWELILHWYIQELELIFRRGLLRDYEERRGRLEVVRGSIDPVTTANAYYQGQVVFDCVFDEFDYDSAPNRVLAEASQLVAAVPTAPFLRRQARRARARFEDVSTYRESDLAWVPDRRSSYYGVAITLARHIIRGVGRTLSSGAEPIKTFLIRTPQMVEAGLRSLLQRQLPDIGLEKRGLQLSGSTMTLTPDLNFPSFQAVGDVKYKLLGSEWPRTDLYQLVAFSTGFRAETGILVSFGRSESGQLPSVQVGDVKLHGLKWLVDDEAIPATSLEGLARSLRLLLTGQEHT